MGTVSSSAIANPVKMYNGTPGTALSKVYNAPAATATVPNDCATAIIKDIVICNKTSSLTTTATIAITNTSDNSVISYLFYNLALNLFESKPFSNLKIALKPGQSISVLASSTSSVAFTISGVEVQ